jgi:hypothetical protein
VWAISFRRPFYRQLVEAEYGVSGIWLQSVYMFALNDKQIDLAEYCDLCVALAAAKHGHLSANFVASLSLNIK